MGGGFFCAGVPCVPTPGCLRGGAGALAPSICGLKTLVTGMEGSGGVGLRTNSLAG